LIGDNLRSVYAILMVVFRYLVPLLLGLSIVPILGFMGAGLAGFFWASTVQFLMVGAFQLDSNKKSRLDFFISGLFFGLAIAALSGAIVITFG
jgi:hypothetical protein